MNKERAAEGNVELGQNPIEHDIFTDPTIAQPMRDPVAEFVKRQWKPLLFTVVLAFVVVYVRDSLKESYERGLKGSANSFYKAQDAFEKYREASKKLNDLQVKVLPTVEADKIKAQKEIDDAKADLQSKDDRFKEAVKVLGDGMEPYSKFSGVLLALAAHQKGDMNAVKAALASYSTDSLATLKGSNRFITEVSLMTLGRALLDSAETEAEGKRILQALAQQGETVAVSAAVTYARIASSEQEKKQAEELLTSLATKFPEQAALLQE